MADYLLSLLLLLLAGWIDAVAYIGFNHTFVAFMSGNSTKVGVGVGAGEWRVVSSAGWVILTFFGGTVVGELVHLAVRPWQRPTVLAILVVLLGGTYGAARAGLAGEWVVMLLGFAMGVQNAVLHRAYKVGVGLTYITGTLVHAGRSLATALIGKGGWWKAIRFVTQWAAMVLGAIVAATTTAGADLSIGIAAALAIPALALALWMGPQRDPDA